MRILLVEDSEHDRIALRRAFERSRTGDVILEAKNASEALKLFQDETNAFDILVADYKMEGGMNGFELCKEAMRLKKDLPTVLMTGYGDEDLAASSIKSGIGDYIVKDLTRSYISKLHKALDRLHSAKLRRQTPVLPVPSRRPSGEALVHKPRNDMAGRLAVSETILELLNKEGSDSMMLEALKCLKAYGPFDVIAIRMRRAGDYPFIAEIGMAPDLKSREMNVCSASPALASSFQPLQRGRELMAPECLCGSVLSGQRPKGVGEFTENGSFWCSECKRICEKSCFPDGFRFRGDCMASGLNSLCLVPIKLDGQIQGLLFVGDRACGAFDKSVVAFLEKTAAFFGVCFERRLMRESLFGYTKDVEEFIRRRTREVTERNVELQAEVKALKESGATLREANSKLEALSKNKALFLARLSHDLRSPLTAIMGFSELLLECGLTGENAEFARLIMDRSQDLAKLIQEIHDLSKLESGGFRLHAELMDLKVLAANVMKGFERQALGKGLTLETDISPRIEDELFADPLRITQIISNLLSNALKFTDAGRIRLSVQPLPPAAPGLATLKFCVSDTGNGISSGDLAKLFEDYAQVHPSKRKQREGSGLGLSICKKLVVLMGGRIWAESALGKGSAFHFTLNLETPERRARADLPRLQ